MLIKSQPAGKSPSAKRTTIFLLHLRIGLRMGLHIGIRMGLQIGIRMGLQIGLRLGLQIGLRMGLQMPLKNQPGGKGFFTKIAFEHSQRRVRDHVSF